MSKTKKIVLISVGGVFVLLLAVVFIVVARLDSIVHGTVEREGTSQLDLATTLGSANVSIFGGSLTLDDLAIANPEGYSAPKLFELGQVNVGVSYRQLMQDPVRIRSININSPRLVIERSGEGLASLGKINLRDLMERLDTSSDEEATRLVIDQLTVSQTQVVIRPNIQGLEEEYVITIPDVTLSNIGTAEEAQNGAEIGRVTTEVAMVLARRAAESNDLPQELRALLAGDLESIIAQYKDKLRQEVTQQLQQQLGDLKEKLGADVTGAAEKLLEGNTQGAAEEVRQRAGDTLNREVERGLGDLLGRRRSGDPATQPATRPE